MTLHKDFFGWGEGGGGKQNMRKNAEIEKRDFKN